MFFLLTNGGKANIINDVDAGLAHLVERHLAKVEVASSSLVTRSRFAADKQLSAAFFVFDLRLGFELELRLAFYLAPCMAGKLCGPNPCGPAWCGRCKQKEIERRLLRFSNRGRRRLWGGDVIGLAFRPGAVAPARRQAAFCCRRRRGGAARRLPKRWQGFFSWGSPF